METSAGAPVGAQLWGDDFIQAEIEPDSTVHDKKKPKTTQPWGILWVRMVVFCMKNWEEHLWAAKYFYDVPRQRRKDMSQIQTGIFSWCFLRPVQV